MANISKTLSEELKSFAKGTNTSKTAVSIISDPEAALKVDPSDTQLQGLVKYSSEGGGNISVKAKGIRRKISTSKTKKAIEVDELQVSGKTPKEIADMLKELLS